MRTLIAILASFLVLAHFAACSNESAEPEFTEDPAEIETDLTDPATLLATHDLAWNQRNRAAYEALLDAEYEYIGLDEFDPPWIDSGFVWFDPIHWDAPTYGDLVEVSSVPREVETIATGFEVECNVHGRVMWSPSEGSTLDGFLLFELIDRDGFLRIRRIVELPRNRV